MSVVRNLVKCNLFICLALRLCTELSKVKYFFIYLQAGSFNAYFNEFITMVLSSIYKRRPFKIIYKALSLSLIVLVRIGSLSSDELLLTPQPFHTNISCVNGISTVWCKTPLMRLGIPSRFPARDNTYLTWEFQEIYSSNKTLKYLNSNTRLMYRLLKVTSWNQDLYWNFSQWQQQPFQNRIRQCHQRTLVYYTCQQQWVNRSHEAQIKEVRGLIFEAHQQK